MMQIPINDLKRQTKLIPEAIPEAIKRVLASGWYILGPEVEAFEEEFAHYCGVNYCIGVANGTEALEIALRALNVSSQNLVATVANAGAYSTTAILSLGAQPLYIDISATTMTMDVECLELSLTETTKAIIVTHLYGQMVDMAKIMAVAQKRGIPVIEDCAQAHGAKLEGKLAGSWADIACFSFYPTKNLGALGDGGAILTKDKSLALHLRSLRQYGWSQKYHINNLGGRNSRLDEFQAAILRIKLPYLDSWNNRRRNIAQQYSQAFQNKELQLPQKYDQSYVAHLYVARSAQRDILREKLSTYGIATDIHYPIPDYQQIGLCNSITTITNLPITEKCCKEVFTLPCYPELTDEEVDYITNTMLKIMGH